MMRAYPGILLLLVASILPLPAMSSEPTWLRLDKSESGFVFKGIREGTEFVLDVPGDTVATALDGTRAFAKIDDVVFQLFTVVRKNDDDRDALNGYADYEKSHQKKLGMEIVASDVCAGMSTEHREWRGVMPNGAISVFVIVPFQNDLLVVVAAGDAFGNAVIEKKLAAACRSFKK